MGGETSEMLIFHISFRAGLHSHIWADSWSFPLFKGEITKDGLKGFEGMCQQTYPSCGHSFMHLIYKSRLEQVEAAQRTAMCITWCG